MWIELDKRQCFIDIIDGKIDLSEEEVRIVGFEDDGWTETLNDTEIGAMGYLISNDDVKLFKKVVDK